VLDCLKRGQKKELVGHVFFDSFLTGSFVEGASCKVCLAMPVKSAA
jgi:hypothetical protein